jgi:thioredoxin-dependent peroxiredoxin
MTTSLTKTKGLMLLALSILALPFQSFTTNKKNKDKMKIQESQAAPNFTIKDVNGIIVNLSDYKGKKVMLTFYRNVGCPVCNIRFHELQEQADYFKSKNMIMLAVYESSAENMKIYLEGETFYAIMLPNTDQNLYKLYDIDRGMGKMMKGMFHGAMKKMKQGKKLFKHEMKQDGNKDRIGADFLIDENGIVKTAYYGKYVGDHLKIEDIKRFLN